MNNTFFINYLKEYSILVGLVMVIIYLTYSGLSKIFVNFIETQPPMPVCQLDDLSLGQEISQGDSVYIITELNTSEYFGQLNIEATKK